MSKLHLLRSFEVYWGRFWTGFFPFFFFLVGKKHHLGRRVSNEFATVNAINLERLKMFLNLNVFYRLLLLGGFSGFVCFPATPTHLVFLGCGETFQCLAFPFVIVQAWATGSGYLTLRLYLNVLFQKKSFQWGYLLRLFFLFSFKNLILLW